jgi:hypothetical protein
MFQSGDVVLKVGSWVLRACSLLLAGESLRGRIHGGLVQEYCCMVSLGFSDRNIQSLDDEAMKDNVQG